MRATDIFRLISSGHVTQVTSANSEEKAANQNFQSVFVLCGLISSKRPWKNVLFYLARFKGNQEDEENPNVISIYFDVQKFCLIFS